MFIEHLQDSLSSQAVPEQSVTAPDHSFGVQPEPVLALLRPFLSSYCCHLWAETESHLTTKSFQGVVESSTVFSRLQFSKTEQFPPPQLLSVRFMLQTPPSFMAFLQTCSRALMSCSSVDWKKEQKPYLLQYTLTWTSSFTEVSNSLSIQNQMEQLWTSSTWENVVAYLADVLQLGFVLGWVSSCAQPWTVSSSP